MSQTKEHSAVWIFFMEEGHGDEMLTGAWINGVYEVFVAHDETRLNYLVPIVRSLSLQWKKSIKLVKFTGRKTIEIISPEGGVRGGN